MGATLYPADLRRRAIEAEVIPFPMPEMTPPETKMYFTTLLFLVLSGTINNSKFEKIRQLRGMIGETPIKCTNTV